MSQVQTIGQLPDHKSWENHLFF